MKLPNWFKIVWWIVLLVITTYALTERYSDIISGKSIPFDVFLFIIWVSLMLVPIFQEINIFGIKLKKEVEDLKNQIQVQYTQLRNDISQNQSQNVQVYGTPAPLPDDKIPELEKELSKLKELISSPEKKEELISIPDRNVFLFKVRYNIEREVERIWKDRYEPETGYQSKYYPLVKQIGYLRDVDLINPNFYGILREIIAICNYGIHGREVSDNQFDLVQKYSEEIIEYLKKR